MKTYVFMSCVLFALARAAESPDLARMTLQQKIGQLFVVATTASFDQRDEVLASSLVKCPYKMDHTYIEELIKRYHIGGLIFLYKGTPEQQLTLTQHFQSLSETPLMICQDGEWGLSMRLHDVLRFPRNMTLGALENKDLIYSMGKEVARQYKLLGVHMNLAPVVDCNTNPVNPVIHTRSFGSDAHDVAERSALMIRGLQDGGVAACAKHFPGHGDTSVDSHHALPVVHHNRARLDRVELLPFGASIDARVSAVMTAHMMVPTYDDAAPASLSRAVTTKLLQDTLKYEGLVITDGLGMGALDAYGTPGERELQAFRAGNDILLCPLDVPAATARIEKAITSGEIPVSYLDAKVQKILDFKKQYGVTRNVTTHEQLYDQLHTPHARALKKELFAQAITVVRDEQENIPALHSKRVCAVQCGGDTTSPFLEEMRASGADTFACHNESDAEQVRKAMQACDVVVVGVQGMTPTRAHNFGVSQDTRALCDMLQRDNKEHIVVLFGTPYSIPLFDAAQTLMVAYEDDMDAQEAVVEILYGKRPASGKLPVAL